MKNFIITITFLLSSVLVNAQLKGSGKISTKNYDYKNFDKVYFENLDGKLTVQIGKTFSIQVTIDDNLASIFSIVENKEKSELIVSFKENWNNKKYIEDTNLKINITMPEASVIKNIGNSDLSINNVIGRYFRIENTGNGNTKVSGSVDAFEVEKLGNGNIDAEKLLTKKATVSNTGNGNVITNVSETITAKLSGNGDVINKGKAQFDNNSKKIGNGSLINN